MLLLRIYNHQFRINYSSNGRLDFQDIYQPSPLGSPNRCISQGMDQLKAMKAADRRQAIGISGVLLKSRELGGINYWQAPRGWAILLKWHSDTHVFWQ